MEYLGVAYTICRASDTSSNSHNDSIKASDRTNAVHLSNSHNSNSHNSNDIPNSNTLNSNTHNDIQFIFDKPALPATKNAPVVKNKSLGTTITSIKIGAFDFETGTYKTVKLLDLNLTFYTEVQHKNDVYIIGGFSKGFCSNKVHKYSLDTKKLHPKPYLLKEPRLLAAAAVYQNKLFIASGKTSGNRYSKTVEVWNFEGQFEIRRPISHPRAEATLFVLGNNLFIMGGYYDHRLVLEIEIYDETTDEWSDYDLMKEDQFGFSSVVVGTRIYIAGGWDCSGRTMNIVRSWSPLNKEWRKERSMSVPRKQFTLAVAVNYSASNDNGGASNDNGGASNSSAFKDDIRKPVIYAIRGFNDSEEKIQSCEKLKLWTEDAEWEMTNGWMSKILKRF